MNRQKSSTAVIGLPAADRSPGLKVRIGGHALASIPISTIRRADSPGFGRLLERAATEPIDQIRT